MRKVCVVAKNGNASVPREIARGIWYSVFSQPPYAYLAKMIPRWYRSRVIADLFLGKEPPSRLAGEITRQAIREYYLLPESEQRRLNRARYWGSTPGKRWHDVMRDVYAGNVAELQKLTGPLVHQLSELFSSHGCFDKICEVLGTESSSTTWSTGFHRSGGFSAST